MATKTDVLSAVVAKEAAAPKAKEAKKAAPKGKAKEAKKAAAAPKEAKKAEPKEAPKKAAAAADTFALHLNKTGRLCIGAAAAERLGEAPFCVLKIEGKICRLIPEKKEVEGALPVKYADSEFCIRPYVSATKQFKALGFDGSEPKAFEAKPYGQGGFEFRYA
jgi:nucleoid-associated protein YgaU